MQNIGKNTQKHTAGGVIILALMALLMAQPAAAQIVNPTPLPQVVATQNAANTAGQQVNDLQAQRAQIQAKLNEINANIENQIKEAEAATADAKIAAATQNAVEYGAAIGRLEGAIVQLKDSYAGKDAIIADLQNRLEQQTTQSADQQRIIDGLTLQLQQAQRDKQNAVNAYNALSAQHETNQQNDMVSNAIFLIIGLVVILETFMLIAFVIQRRRAVVIDPPPTEPPLDGDYTVSNEDIGG